MQLLVLITSKLESGLKVATAWQEAGAPGVTIMPSYGLYTLRQNLKALQVELPPYNTRSMAAAVDLLETTKHTNHVILSLVPKDMIPELTKVTQDELGDLEDPYTGILFVMDILKAIGVFDHAQGVSIHALADNDSS